MKRPRIPPRPETGVRPHVESEDLCQMSYLKKSLMHLHKHVVPRMTSFCHKGMLRGSLGSELGVGIKTTPLSLTSCTFSSRFFFKPLSLIGGIDSICSTFGPFLSCMLMRSSAR